MSGFSRTGDKHDRLELLVQRFVDQELTAEERVQLLVAPRAGRGLRQRALALEQLCSTSASCRGPSCPMDLSRVSWSGRHRLHRRYGSELIAVAVDAARVSVESRGRRGCRRLALLDGGGGLVMRLRDVSIDARAPSWLQRRRHAGSTSTRVLVRLVVVQPGARTVQAAGDFNGWNPTATPLEQTSNGAWTVTIPLEPGRYEYQFVVDGEQWIADPFAVEQNDDGFGSRNAVLDVRPPLERRCDRLHATPGLD